MSEFYHTFFSPFEKFEVTDYIPNGKYPPGTTGYISYQLLQPHKPGMGARLCNRFKAVVTRRGKSGKNRLESTTIISPALYEEERGKDVEKAYECPFNELRMVEIVPAEYQNKNIEDMPPLDFIAWASAFAQFLHFIRHNYVDLAVWPKSKNNPLNIFRDISRLCYNLDNLMKHGHSINVFYNEYAHQQMRLDFIESARQKETQLTRAINNYRQNVENWHTNAYQVLMQRLNLEIKKGNLKQKSGASF